MSFDNVYDIIVGLTPGGLEWLAFLVAGGILAFAVINAVVMSGAIYTWFERRALGRFQSRLGPNRWGPFGLFQPFADILKLLSKEDVVPEPADRVVFHIAPLFLAIPVLLVFAVIPFGENSFLGRLNVGVLFIIGVTGINTFGVFMGGYASRNKYALFGAMRGVAMLISYEVPMALALTGVALAAGSLALTDIVESQSLFFVVTQPLGFLVFMTAASAEMSRAPFDMIEAESELGSGYHTEYSGMKFAVFQLAEFMAPVVNSVIATVLFLGGAEDFGPIPGQVAFVVKVFALVFFFLWVRSTWPRLRVDQIMAFAWKGLFAMAIINLFAVATEMWLLLGTDVKLEARDLWIMAVANWVVAIASIVLVANLLGQRKVRPEAPVPSPLANMAVEAD
jgi:NADH-quinone oxidoreductase subunit H